MKHQWTFDLLRVDKAASWNDFNWIQISIEYVPILVNLNSDLDASDNSHNRRYLVTSFSRLVFYWKKSNATLHATYTERLSTTATQWRAFTSVWPFKTNVLFMGLQLRWHVTKIGKIKLVKIQEFVCRQNMAW